MSVPSHKWAQDANNVFLTIELSGLKDCKIDFEEQAMSFAAEKDGKQFELALQLREKVDAAKCTYGVRDRHVEVRLVKAAEGFWPHMLNAENKKRYKNMCKVDWDRWIDSDDEGEAAEDQADFGRGGGGDLAQMMQSMGGMGAGMGGMGAGMPGMGDGRGGEGDLAQMMQSMGGMGAGGMPGMGGADGGGMDMAALQKMMAGLDPQALEAAGASSPGVAEDEDDDDLPELEEEEDEADSKAQ